MNRSLYFENGIKGRIERKTAVSQPFVFDGYRTEFRQEARTCKEVVHTDRFRFGVKEYRIASLMFRAIATFISCEGRLSMDRYCEEYINDGLYDLTPARERLRELIDFGRLNDGSLRVMIVATDPPRGGIPLFCAYHLS
jgi:hypothetical protein